VNGIEGPRSAMANYKQRAAAGAALPFAGDLKGFLEGPEGAEQRFLFPLPVILSGDEFTLPAAGGAEPDDFAAHAPKGVDARIAKGLLALHAFATGADLGMIQARRRPIGKKSRRGLGEIQGGYGDGRRSDFQHHADIAQLQGFTRFEESFLDWLIINEGAICRIAISNHDPSTLPNDFAMVVRNCGVFDGEIVSRSASEPIAPGTQFDCLNPAPVPIN